MKNLAAILTAALSIGSASAQQLAPNGTWVGGTPQLAPNGAYVGGTPQIAPNGSYVGVGRR